MIGHSRRALRRGARSNAPSAAVSTVPPTRHVRCVYLTLFGSGLAGLGFKPPHKLAISMTARECEPTPISLVPKETARRVGIERCQSRVETEPRPAVGTKECVRRTHIDVDVRVVLRRGHAEAPEFPDPDPNFRDAAVVPELRIVVGHRLGPL